MIKYAAQTNKRHFIKKTTCGKNFSYNLHGQLFRFQSFIENLKSTSLLLLLM